MGYHLSSNAFPMAAGAIRLRLRRGRVITCPRMLSLWPPALYDFGFSVDGLSPVLECFPYGRRRYTTAASPWTGYHLSLNAFPVAASAIRLRLRRGLVITCPRMLSLWPPALYNYGFAMDGLSLVLEYFPCGRQRYTTTASPWTGYHLSSNAFPMAAGTIRLRLRRGRVITCPYGR